MKKILLSLCALAMALTMSAQQKAQSVLGTTLQRNPAATALNLKPTAQAQKAPRRIALADNQRVLGPYATDTYATQQEGLGLGQAITLPIAAVLQKGNWTHFNGTTVKTIRFALADSCKIDNVFLIDYDDNTGALDTIAYQTLSGERLGAGWHEVTLDTPGAVNITSSGILLLGYTAELEAAVYPLSYVNEGDICPSYIQYRGEWQDLGTEDYGNLSVQAIAEGEFPANAASIAESKSITVLPGTLKTVYLKANNLGSSLSSIDYTVTLNGETESHHFDITNPLTTSGGSKQFPVAVTTPTTPGKYVATVKITKVNNVDNAVAGTGTITINVVSKEVQHNVLVEEFTGTGCGWCPRGHVGMKHMREQFGDSFVGVALHCYNVTSDPMVSFYAYSLSQAIGFTGAPSASFDRKTIVDPYYEGPSTFSSVQKLVPLAGLTVKGEWNADSTAVNATASVEGVIDGNFEVFYMLTADDLNSTANNWKQTNYYSQYSVADAGAEDDPDIAQFCSGQSKGQSPVSVTYNDVLLTTSLDIYTGENQGGTVSVKDGETATSTFSIAMPTSQKYIVQNGRWTLSTDEVFPLIKKDKVTLIAVLLDPTTGEVINSAQYHMSPVTAIKGIDNTAKSNRVVARYNLAGQRVGADARGIVIEKMADGSSKKVMK